ncbi:hypothetical protein OG21DRAFT_1491337 [Imleria badia]|nr:hypothetical protein OG21DRAFT_1491337 [Imleria badia]
MTSTQWHIASDLDDNTSLSLVLTHLARRDDGEYDTRSPLLLPLLILTHSPFLSLVLAHLTRQDDDTHALPSPSHSLILTHLTRHDGMSPVTSTTTPALPSPSSSHTS